MLAASATSQIGGPAPQFTDKRKQASSLFDRARQLKERGDFNAADALVRQAESLGVDYKFTFIGDTPSRMRREIQKARDAANKSPSLPSQISLPSLFGKKKEAPTVSPFAGRDSEKAITVLTNKKTVAQSFLRSGRDALMSGNLPAASHYYRMAMKEPATFGPMEYSPSKLAAEIRAAGGVVAEAPAARSALAHNPAPPKSVIPSPVPLLEPYGFATAQSPSTRLPKAGPPMIGAPAALPPVFARQRAVLPAPAPLAAGEAMASDYRGTVEVQDAFLRDARRALAEGDVDRAHQLIAHAGTQRREYGPRDDTPNKVAAAIGEYQVLKQMTPGSGAFRRAYSDFLMEQARALTRHQDYDRAEQLAYEASQQQVIYKTFEMKPNELLAKISAERRHANRPETIPMVSAIAKAPSTPMPSMAAKRKAMDITRQARQAYDRGQLELAEQLARQAGRLQVPRAAYAPGEDRPELVLMDIDTANGRNPSRVIRTGGQMVVAATGTQGPDNRATHAIYNPANDPTRNLPAQFQQPESTPLPSVSSLDQPPEFLPKNNAPTPAPPQPPTMGTTTPFVPSPGLPSPSPLAPIGISPRAAQGMALFQKGRTALIAHQATEAYQYFQQAAPYMDSLDASTQQSLRTYLQNMVRPGAGQPAVSPPNPMGSGTLSEPEMLARQISMDVARQEVAAQAMQTADPRGALALLQETRAKVESASLAAIPRQQLLRRLDRAISLTQQNIEQHRPAIELAEYNERVRSEVQRERNAAVEIEESLAMLVDEFNRRMDEGNYLQAEAIAKRAAELSPDQPIVLQMKWMAKFVSQYDYQMAMRDDSESGFVNALRRVQERAIPFDDNTLQAYPDNWKDLIAGRARFGENQLNRTPAEIEIEAKLKTPVRMQFNGEPLANVLDYLGKAAGVNTYLVPLALEQEGISSSTPVTIDLQNEIMLKSALHLILERFHLGYIIKDEVLKITSEQQCEGDVKRRTYHVADLVIPIANFQPGPMGLDAAYRSALGNMAAQRQGGFGFGGAPMSVLATKDGTGGAGTINPGLLANVVAPGGGSMPIGAGPGGLGGGNQADFDSLIELIETTIKPDSWDIIGGPGSIAPFETNLTLVVSQTQEVHEQIVDLLEQLRRLQDLQVTIEVRFITLNDTFFERIGVDFDFDIDDDIDRPFQVFGRKIAGQEGDPATGAEPGRNTLDVDWDPGKSVVVGMQQPGVFSADLDIPFTQGSFGLAVPQFGGFDAAAGAQLGFAILSDIEAFFFISAAQGDRRSNVMQAPKVTLFNGQQAYVSDTSQSPFVVSVIPVVGEFAAAQQPVIVVLSEGTMMTVQAVVSPDRRYVRLTVVPFFSKIDKVNTFQFTGSETSTTDVSADGIQDAPNDSSRSSAATTRTRSGTTVQLPTFSFVTVTTTVSVPDGGTVLLGGIKRLSEGRNEFGVPMLNKIPYINRLFKNVGIGRETQSLMMMVTPRIIIQEEQEALVIGAQPE